MAEQYQYWKKNNDSKYISGEDLQDGLLMAKGLRPEMVVIITGFEDKQTFDQNANEKVTKTGLWLAEYPSGTKVYKPVILNNTNAYFCIDEFKSKNLYDWLNKPLVLWAQVDRRHGFVARFKKYYPPAQVNADVEPLAKLNNCKTLADLGAIWEGLSPSEKKLPTVLARKEALKATLK